MHKNDLIKDSAWNTLGTKRRICSSNGNCGGINRSRVGCGDNNEELVKGPITKIEVAVNWH